MYCENANCRKTGLNKAEVERDKKTNLLLCLGCYSLANPGWVPEQSTSLAIPGQETDTIPRFGYSMTIDSVRGVSALLSYGDIGLELTVPKKTMRGFLGA